MNDEERRRVVVSLATLIRKLGWEDLIDQAVTPEDAERGEIDPAQARALLEQIRVVARDLLLVEQNLLTDGPGLTLTFKPDLGEAVSAAERGVRIDREQYQPRALILRTLGRNLSTLGTPLTTSVDELLADIEDGLSHVASLGYSSASAVEDVYEAFVWWRLVRAAMALGWTATLRDPDGPVTGDLRFRLGPGRIYSDRPFTFAQLDHPEWPTLEVHLGIMVDGRSGVDHEFDVVALTKAGADLSRDEGRNPHWTDVAAHAECKFYGAPLPLGLGRGLWGLSADCRLRRRGGLATNSAPAESVAQLLGRHGVYYCPNARPSVGQPLANLDMALRLRLIWWLRDQGFPV